jgi:catechol 2,3-dioxygenase-like lactoylglutathione lyase family enzyme
MPELYVSDIARSLAFFRDKLGFITVFEYGEPPFYAQVRRGNAGLNLRSVDGPVFAGDIRAREQLLAASVAVEDIEALFREFEAAGADFALRLTRQPWGAQNCIVRDPDGNLLLFAE